MHNFSGFIQNGFKSVFYAQCSVGKIASKILRFTSSCTPETGCVAQQIMYKLSLFCPFYHNKTIICILQHLMTSLFYIKQISAMTNYGNNILKLNLKILLNNFESLIYCCGWTFDEQIWHFRKISWKLKLMLSSWEPVAECFRFMHLIPSFFKSLRVETWMQSRSIPIF